MQSETEYVVLVDEQNRVLKTMPKSLVHGKDTPLHRGFSVFVFNSNKELLVQKRSLQKKTWPGVWSNSCCGHPMLNESDIEASKRRLKFELGMEVEVVEKIADYRYKFIRDEIMENEICPILVGFSNQIPKLNLEEVSEISYINWQDFLAELNKNVLPEDIFKWSDWCREESFILDRSPKFHQFLEKNV